MSEKGSTRLLDFIEKFEQDFGLSSSERQNLCIEKHSEGANNFQNFVIPALDDTKMVKKNFKSILHYVKQTIWKPWSDRQHEFVVLTCSEDEAFNIINCLSVLSAIAFKEGDTTSLEEIQRIVDQYQHHPGTGIVMNNLGVMFSENAMYKKSEKCFDIAKSYFEDTLCRQDNQRDACAVVTLNLAVLHMVLGNYKEAEHLSAAAASLCHDISMRTTKDVHLPWKLLRRVADMLKEFGNYKQLHIILRIGVHYGVSGTDEGATIDLTKQSMKIQLKEQSGKTIQSEEVEDYISYLFALLDKPAAELLNAEFIGTVMSAAKIHRNIGHHKEACKLLKKLKDTFLKVYGGRCSLYGSLLYQIGSFLYGSGKFDEAESVLKQAKEILIHHFGRSHHAVAMCKSLLGSCLLLKGNTKAALKHLNEALAMFKKLNPNHPEVGQILLRLAYFYVEEGTSKYAQKALQEAVEIFISGCGELSCKTASAYFQLAMILQKVDEFRTSAVDKIKKVIEILLNLGLNLDHPDVKVCSSFLGVLQRSLGMTEEAEKCFLDVQTSASLCEDSCSMAAKIITPEVINLHCQVKSDDSRGRFSSLEAQVISLVNLVHMKKDNERGKHLDTLVSCLEELETVELQIWDFAGQNVYCVSHRIPVFDRPVFLIISSDLKPRPSQFIQGLNLDSLNESESDNSSDSDIFLSSSANKSHFVLFSRIPFKVQEIKEAKCLASAFRESVNTLFLQPKFRKGFLEGKDFYMELPGPTGPGDVSSLCSQIDCLPLLVELELLEAQEQCNNFDYLTSWEHSVKYVMPSAHVSYFSYKCSSQRETEFVFDRLIHSLDILALNKVQSVVSNVSPVQNAASFFFQEPRNSSLSVTVDSQSVLVKCRTIKESELNCICSSVRNALDVAMESCQTVGLHFVSSAWLTCEGVGSGLGIEECSSRNCNLGVQSDPSCAALISATGDLIPCASAFSTGPESELKRKPTADTVDMLQDENMEVDPSVGNSHDNFHADVDVCLCLLSCLLSQVRPVSPEEEVLSLNSSVVSSTDYARCGSNSQDNHDHSFLSVGSSLNSLPPSPPFISESGHCPFTSKKSPSECLSSENNAHPSPETSTCMNSKLVSKNSTKDSYKSNGLSVKLPEKPSPDGCHMSSYEVGLTAGKCCPGPETKETKQLEEEGEEERLCFATDRKDTGMQDICTNDSELLSTELHQDEFPQSIPGPSFAASSEKIDAGTLTDDFLRPLLANLEGDLAISQKDRYELQQQISQLEEQLRQSEEEKQNLQAVLGKYQFLEEKEKRREKLLGGAAPVQDPGRHVHLSNGKKKGHERLLGGATPVQDPGFPMHERLLEISNSLSAEEVKRIKFLAKSKVNGFQVNGFRLARCTEAFQLFEELESNGEFPCDYIGKLLAGIQRYDLVDKLGIHNPLPAAERGSNHPPGQNMPDKEHELPDHATNLPKSMTAQDNSMEVPSNRHDRERHLSNGGNRNDHLSRTGETDYDCSQYASISSGGSSDETRHYTTKNELTCGDLVVLRINAESDSSSSQGTGNANECTRLPNSSDDDLLSDSSCSRTISSSDSLVNSTQATQAAASNCTSEASSDSTEGSPMLTSVNSHSAFGSNQISSDSGLTPTSSEEEYLRSSQMLADEGEESEDKDVCDGAIRIAPLHISACAVSAGTSSSDSSTCGFVRTQSGANVGNILWSQQGAFPSAEMAAGGTHTSSSFNGTAADWERLGARPKQGRTQHSVIKQMPGEPFIPLTDGLAGDFLARHTQDKALHDSLYQSVGTEMPLFNDTASQGTSYIDGVITVSDSNKAKPYVGDCHVVSGTDPYSRLGVSSGRFDGRGISYSEHLNNNTGPLPSHLGDNYFSVYGNYSQRNALNATNGLPLQSGFVHTNSRFLEHFGGAPHLPLETQQVPFPTVPSSQFVNSGVTASSGFADLAWNSTTVGIQSGHPVYGAQRYTSFNDNASTSTSAQSTRQTPQNRNLSQGNHSSSNTNNDHVPSASARNVLHEDVQNSALPAACAVSSCDPTRATGLDSTTTNWPSLVCHSSNTTTVGDDVLAQGSTSGTSIPEPSCGNTDNHGASVLNNRDFGTDSVESTDNSLVALEQRVAEACALVERVLREREEREQFGREIERKEQLIREQRARERREREEREIQEAERWPQQQEAITARSQWLCEHYQRHCRVRFPCCTQFFPCHRCHNISKACDNEEAKACHASHLKCSHCQHEQEIGEDSEKCRKCGGKMSAYFCSICKHFTSIDKNPYHCEKCGICRIHKDKSFHCEVCNVCLDKRLQGNHKCRPDSGHDECCICLEDAFSGCQILPCSHKVHRECAIAMIQNGIRTCPICRHPLYSPPRE